MSKVDNTAQVEVILLMEQGDTHTLNRVKHILDKFAIRGEWSEESVEDDYRLSYPIAQFGVEYSVCEKRNFNLTMPYGKMDDLESNLRLAGGVLRYLVVNRSK